MFAMSNKPATGVYEPTNKTEVVEEPDLEIGEGCLNVNKDIKKFLDNVGAWSNKLDELFADSQAQAKMITEIAESHQGLGKMEHKVAYLEKKGLFTYYTFIEWQIGTMLLVMGSMRCTQGIQTNIFN